MRLIKVFIKQPPESGRWRFAACCFLLGALTLVLSACAGHILRAEPTRGVYHQVKKGETLWSIARAYRANIQELAELNNITNNSIEVGDAVFIPGAIEIIENTVAGEKQLPAKPAVPSSATAAAPPKKIKPAAPPVVTVKKQPDKPHEVDPSREAATDTQPGVQMDKKRFAWPVKGTIVSRYGIQSNGLKNNGIRIGAKENTPVQAAADGEVTYSSTLKYYGDTIIIKHGDDFSTVYSSLKGRGVKVGDRVKRGETIAQVGKVENEGDACLNFEVREKNKPRNPLFFLP